MGGGGLGRYLDLRRPSGELETTVTTVTTHPDSPAEREKLLSEVSVVTALGMAPSESPLALAARFGTEQQAVGRCAPSHERILLVLEVA